MPTTRETILQALHALLQTQPAPVLRGEVLPERVPAAGLLILRDGDPGEPAVTLSPLRYHYQHRAEIEAVVQTGTGRDAAFDALAAGVGTVLAADRTLGGLVRLGRGGGAAPGRPCRRRRGDAEGRRHPDRAALRERRPARLGRRVERGRSLRHGLGGDLGQDLAHRHHGRCASDHAREVLLDPRERAVVRRLCIVGAVEEADGAPSAALDGERCSRP